MCADYGGYDHGLTRFEAYDMESLTGDICGLAHGPVAARKLSVISGDGARNRLEPFLGATQDTFRASGRPVRAPISAERGRVHRLPLRAFFTGRACFLPGLFQDEGPPRRAGAGPPAETIRKFLLCHLRRWSRTDYWTTTRKHGDTLLHRLPEPPMPSLVSRDVAYLDSQFPPSGLSRDDSTAYRN